MKKVLIVGSSGGIGSKLSIKFDSSGWKSASLSRKIDESGGRLLALEVDLSDSAQVEKAIKRLKQEGIVLDALIFAAGQVQDKLLLKMSEAEWDEVVAVNLKAVWALMCGVAPLLSGGGHIVLLGSGAGVTGKEGQVNYSAAKAGLIGLSKSAAKEWGEQNIRCNVVLPGFLRTNMTAHLSEKQVSEYEANNVLKRLGSVDEVAEFIYFLCSTKNISGQVFNLDSRILPTF